MPTTTHTRHDTGRALYAALVAAIAVATLIYAIGKAAQDHWDQATFFLLMSWICSNIAERAHR